VTVLFTEYVPHEEAVLLTGPARPKAWPENRTKNRTETRTEARKVDVRSDPPLVRWRLIAPTAGLRRRNGSTYEATDGVV